MSITIGRYEFEGPLTLETVENRAGVYALLREQAGDIEVIDLGEAREVRDTLVRRCHYIRCENAADQMQLFVHYTPSVLSDRRIAIAGEIRSELECEPEHAA